MIWPAAHIVDGDPRRMARVSPGRNRRILVADDDRVQLKLARLQLEDLGFVVEAVADGAAALAAARANPPAAIVSDVLMPRMDGFRLCLAVRKDPALRETRIILQSCKYTDEADRSLAIRLGADAYLSRSPDSLILSDALLAALESDTRPEFEDVEGGAYSEYLDRVVKQLEVQSAQNEQRATQYRQLASALSVLGAASEALALNQPTADAIRDTLRRCIDAAGVSVGILYVCDEAGTLRVHTSIGHRDEPRGAADECFGHPEFFATAAETGASVRIPSSRIPKDVATDFLMRLGRRTALIMPVVFVTERIGAILLASDARELSDTDWTGFAKVLAGQIGQAIALGRAFESVRDSAAKQVALEAKLVNARKMEAVGRLAGGFAHDLNNQLTAIGGFAELIREALPADDPCGKDADEIRMAAERATELTRRMLSFGRQQPVAASVVDVNAAIGKLDGMLRRAIREDVQFVMERDPAACPVLIDPVQMEQVIVNLVLNARDATPSGGRIMIQTRRMASGDSSLHPRAGEGLVAVSVRDTGCGMTDEVRERIFEPFFTTKPVGRGTGLGLATVSGIVEQNEGRLIVESEVGKGSTFTLYLPLAERGDALAPALLGPTMKGPHVATILVVDDNAAIRILTKRTLARAGYHVLEAADAITGRAIIEADDVNVLVSDVVMPGMDGRELAALFHDRHPSGASILMSGLGNDAMKRRGPLPPETRLLAKPFSTAELLSVVREAIQGLAHM
jgi:signal transduction histidine kinase